METAVKPAEEGRKIKTYEPEDLPLRTQYAQVIGTGIVLVFLFLKRVLWGKSAGAGSSFVHTVAALTTIITGYPILRSGVDHLSGPGSNRHHGWGRAPALAQADVGIAMGTGGTDIAILHFCRGHKCHGTCAGGGQMDFAADSGYPA